MVLPCTRGSYPVGRVPLAYGEIGICTSSTIPLLPHLCEEGVCPGLRPLFLPARADRPGVAVLYAPWGVAKRPSHGAIAPRAPHITYKRAPRSRLLDGLSSVTSNLLSARGRPYPSLWESRVLIGQDEVKDVVIAQFALWATFGHGEVRQEKCLELRCGELDRNRRRCKLWCSSAHHAMAV